MPLLLNAEQEDLRKTIRAFCEKEVKPNLLENDEKGIFPDDIYQKGFELGLNQFEMPEDCGGLDLDYRTCAMIYETLGYYDAGLALTVATTNLALKPVLIAGTQEQKQHFCDRVLEGGQFGPKLKLADIIS